MLSTLLLALTLAADPVPVPLDPDTLTPGQTVTLVGTKQTATLTVTAVTPNNTFDVTTFGAIPDDGKDDTAAIRSAFAAAAAFGETSEVVFPAGTFDVCPQPTDAASTMFRPIFALTKGVSVRGAGSGKTILRGWFDGLKDPVANWKNLDPKAYFKVQRFSLFQVITNRLTGPEGVYKFTGLTMDGQCPFTGNNTVGGVQATGDGWDMTHKCLHFDGNQPIGGLEVTDCDLRNWKGEVVYAGGTALGYAKLTNATVRGSNASAVSMSTALTMEGCTVGGDGGDRVYNGVENFCRVASQSTVARHCTFQCGQLGSPRGNGVAYIGVDGASLTCDDCDFKHCVSGLLFSEAAYGVNVHNCRFTDCGRGAITSILNLYPELKGQTGFRDVTFDGCTSDGGNFFVGQTGHCQGLKVKNCTLVGTILLGTFNSPADGFEVSGNTLGGASSHLVGTYAGNAAALWSGNTRAADTNPMYAGQKFDATGDLLIKPACDYLVLNSLPKGATSNVSVDPKWTAPDGFACQVVANQAGWSLLGTAVPKGGSVTLSFTGGVWQAK